MPMLLYTRWSVCINYIYAIFEAQALNVLKWSMHSLHDEYCTSNAYMEAVCDSSINDSLSLAVYVICSIGVELYFIPLTYICVCFHIYKGDTYH